MTNQNEEWGPWIEHDGTGCPVDAGTWIMTREVCKGRGEHFDECRTTCAKGATGRSGGSWDWGNWPEYTKVIRYRIRKPRALSQLQEMIRNLPERIDA